MKKYLYILLVFSVSLLAQISPGDLTEAHKHLEGISNCTKCHELGEEVKNEKCLDCHSDIRNSLQTNSGYHSHPKVKPEKCYTCHSEHHGRKFEIIRFDRNTFDHSATGFNLTGKHTSIECGDCHTTKFILLEDYKNKKGTFFGLSQNCITCHNDYHQGTLSSNCETCHTTEKFIPAQKFNHDTAKFKLTGAHNNVQCKDCHKIEIRNNSSFQLFAGLQFDRCIDCHEDTHKGKFGQTCEDCHSTVSFTKIKNIDNFDHAKTNFPLIGRHQLVGCRDCHKTTLSTKPKHEKCIDCHGDFHKGEFSANGQTKDCSQCHTELGFMPSTFTLELHQKTRFPLNGSHLALPCYLCHKVNVDYQFRFASLNCIQCHENIHKGFIQTKFLSDENCEQCHKTTLWSDVEFDHSRTNFRLEGKHKEILCSDCHFEKSDKEFKQNFENLQMACESCHNDVHFNQFKVEGKTNCERCHTFDNWLPEKFDHSNTLFPLDGAHSKVNCQGCHKQIETPAGKFVKYKFEEIKCINCHSS
ncbi:MAG: cytochrome C [Melioribacteraceae bacterium]|nr:cytochrome C [Melioribacteraceae bacterium]